MGVGPFVGAAIVKVTLVAVTPPVVTTGVPSTAAAEVPVASEESTENNAQAGCGDEHRERRHDDDGQRRAAPAEEAGHEVPPERVTGIVKVAPWHPDAADAPRVTASGTVTVVVDSAASDRLVVASTVSGGAVQAPTLPETSTSRFGSSCTEVTTTGIGLGLVTVRTSGADPLGTRVVPDGVDAVVVSATTDPVEPAPVRRPGRGPVGVGGGGGEQADREERDDGDHRDDGRARPRGAGHWFVADPV